MQWLNACRMYLRVSRLSEIATAQGTKLRSAVLKGNEEGIHLSQERWPRQAQPVAADSTFWSKMLRAVFPNDGAPPSLWTHLGEWKTELVSADKFSREIFCRIPNGFYEVFEEKDGGTSHRSLWVSGRSHKVIDTLPFDVVPVEKHCKVLYREARVYLHPVGWRRLASLNTLLNSIQSDCDLTETATQTLLRSSGPVYGGTDGGLLNELGTFGFVCGEISKANALLPIGKGHVPGAPLIMSSTRTEMAELFAATTHLCLVVEYYAITPTKTTSYRIYCDSKSALARVGDKRHDGFGLRSRSDKTDLPSAVANPHFVALGESSCECKETS
jgi:hypothetical protein